MTKETIRVGGATGFWGESAIATSDLVSAGKLDYLVFDFLAEITMSILARARQADAATGYALDFVSTFLEPQLDAIAAQRIKVISNAGGVNAAACAAAIRNLISTRGLDLSVGVVTGDDLLDRAGEFAGVAEMFTGEALPSPERLASINAYLGAFPIARALSAGADIVVTGRVVDSAVTLGACIHAFGWSADEFDALAGGSLAGHVLECTAQATGGNFTDWETVSESLETIGYPIAEIFPDGSFVCTKPDGTGGTVTPATVTEQMLYEIGDPQAYLLPDVICDFSEVTVCAEGTDRVRVGGARGRSPSTTYKVSATYADGYRGGQLLFFYGFDADRKARRYGEVTVARANRQLRALGLGELSETCIETFGDESHYGARRRVAGAREVTVKIAARHPSAKAIAVFLREIIGIGLGAPPGLCGFAGSRPKPSPVIRLFSFLLDKEQVPVTIEVDGATHSVDAVAGKPFDPADIERPGIPSPIEVSPDFRNVPLIRLAFGRSGDKGNNANVGIVARQPRYLSYIWAALTEDAVADGFAHLLEGPVERFLLPGTNAINFVLHDVLGGGGIASLRNDPQGKGYAQLLLDFPIPVPADIAEALQ